MGTATAHGVAEQATAAATAAAARAGVEITPITGAEDSHRVSRLLSEIWATNPDQPLVPAEVIRSNAHVNGYGAMATSGADIIGAALGIFGRDQHGFYLHSYVAGVKEERRDGSVGFALKQHQRSWALAHGLTRITWTFDPLVRRNAFFNLVKLGAVAVGFHRDFYGSMRDGVNAGDRSDRIVVEAASRGRGCAGDRFRRRGDRGDPDPGRHRRAAQRRSGTGAAVAVRRPRHARCRPLGRPRRRHHP